MSLKGVRDAIAAAINNTADLGVRALSGAADQVAAPQAWVYVKRGVYDDTLDDAWEPEFTIRVHAGRVSERSAQNLLDDLAEAVGATSLKAAVEADEPLRDLVDWVLVTEFGEIGVITVGIVDYMVRDWTVRVGL